MRDLTPSAMHEMLRRHVLDPWFPRCLDGEHGGFLCDFDHRWRPSGPQVRMLEFQARQTRVAALACRLHPGEPMWEDACRRGLEVLCERMWDHEYGGWFVLADRDWRPIDTATKHLHGMAYATQTLLEVARSIDAPDAVGFARRAFEWIDVHAWDARHGLYWGWLTRDGTPIGDDPSGAPRERDHIGAPPGVKDINTNGDMLEMLTEMRRRADHGTVGERLARLVAQFDRWTAETGRLPARFSAALEPLGELGPGYEIQAGWRLPLARAALGESLRFGPVERALRDAASARRGRRGGVLGMSGREEWWIQFELLRSYAFHASVAPDEPAPTDAARRQFAYLERTFIDHRHGGVVPHPPRPLRPEPKGDRWKDGSHEAMALAAAAICVRPREGAMTVADDPWP